MLISPLEIKDIETESAYLLGGGDLLAIRVFESEKLNAEVRVSSRGVISRASTPHARATSTMIRGNGPSIARARRRENQSS